MPAVDATDEFGTLDRLFRPLAHPVWGRGLTDDVGVVPSRPGHDLVLTKDAIVEGVHFLPDDPFDLVARKLLRVNLSDLAAKGAEPFGYLLACHWSSRCGWPAREAFAAGLAEDQAAFGLGLIGGDTVSTPGPASFSATLLGWAPRDGIVGRAGARPGDLVLVTGTIGDGGLGLQAAQGRLELERELAETLAARYRLPEPRLVFGAALPGRAHASADVSDGLAADAGRIAAASGVAIALDLGHLPLSAAARAWVDSRADPDAALAFLATAGDDYEIVLTCAPAAEAELMRAAAALHLRLTTVGRVTDGEGVSVTRWGRHLPLERQGWRHG
ncbi:thiamine-phosphate kinase [Brevundimonas sp.]|jgi:thiamine-monophosphate kinase|uniref:thiamine-phosphate kinase n=1 Tax=Brevundimonas sp. TaxID=1871086 RepID=UPI003918D50A